MQVSGVEAFDTTPWNNYDDLGSMRPPRVLFPKFVIGLHGTPVTVHTWIGLQETLLPSPTQTEEMQPRVAIEYTLGCCANERSHLPHIVAVGESHYISEALEIDGGSAEASSSLPRITWLCS